MSEQQIIDAMARVGVVVTREDIPGLYRVNGHPELTWGQLLELARDAGAIVRLTDGSIISRDVADLAVEWIRRDLRGSLLVT